MGWRPAAPPVLPPSGGLKGAGKRPMGPGQASGGLVAVKTQKPSAEAAIVVFSTAEKDEIGIRTLIGDYQEEGSNHGRKYYKKMGRIPGHEEIDVYLYYWDERDGPSFSGWWFGNQVGGAQVWSRNIGKAPTPPRNGWTIPWDGDVKKELVVMNAQEKQALARRDAEARKEIRRKEELAAQNQETGGPVDWEERVKAATLKVAEVEMDTDEALEEGDKAMEGEIDDEITQPVLEKIMVQATRLAETQRYLAQEGLAAQRAPANLKAEVMSLGQRVRKLQGRVKDEATRLKNAKQIKMREAREEERRAEQEIREKELEGQHQQQLEEMMPAAMEKVDVADDEVEKCAIAAAPLQIETADDLRPVMLEAIKDTEQRVRAAQAAIGEARRFITGKLTQVQRFVPSTKKTAVEEFSNLQEKLNEAQTKLNPFKTVRSDYEQRVEAKKLVDELSGKLAGAEIEVEKAAMMTAPLGGDSSEGIKETEQALQAAQSALTQTLRLIDLKLKGADKNKGPVFDEVKVLQERAQQAQEKLDEVRKTVKETQVRIAADTLLREVTEKVSNAEDELQRMAEAELPFLKGEHKGQDMDALIKEADDIAEKVHTALVDAQTFVARKLVEVARFTEGPAKAVREEVDMLQKRLEEGRERLAHFKSSTGDRKRSHLLQEVESKVSAAEAEVTRMSEATASLSSIGPVGEAISDNLNETLEQANLAERAAQAGIVVARKHLLQKTTELKKLAVAGAGSGTELGKLQTRVNTMQQEIAKMKAATKDAEERVRVKQMLAEVLEMLQRAEAEVDKVASMAVPDAEEQPSAEAVERMEKSTASAQNKLTTTTKLVDVKLKNAQGFLREELQGMRGRLFQAEKKLGDVIAHARDQKERLQASELIALAVEKVEKAEASVQRTEQAELPFLKGIEVLASKEAQNAIVESEAAAASSQKAITDARTFVVQKIADAKEFAEGPSEACTKELLSLQKRLDAGASKLAELKKDTSERKRKTQMQASAEKIANVEASVQNLATAMTRFADDRLATITANEAREVCEEIANSEQEATVAVSSARKFLAQRMQEMKSFSEAQRAPLTADISKLQSRLTQCQVELAKLSKQCTEREQRFVAQKLLQEAAQTVEKLQADIEIASKVAAPMITDDNGEILKAMYMQTMVGALKGHMRESGTTPEALFGTIAKSKIATEEELKAFLDKIPGLTGKDDASFTEEQVATIIGQLKGKAGKVTAAEFQALFQECHVCTASVPLTNELEGGKESGGTIEVGETVEVLEQEQDKAGNSRARCVLARDGTTAWTTLRSAEGAANFKPSSGGAGRMDSVMAFINAVHSRCSDAADFFDKKTVEVAGVKQGPLAEVKAKLLQLRMKISQEQSKIEQLKKRATTAKMAAVQKRKEEQQKVAEVRCKAFAERSVREATEKVVAAEGKATKVVESAQSGSPEKMKDLTIPQLEEITKAADGAIQALEDAKAFIAKISEEHETYKGPIRNLLLEARVELTKLTTRATGAERKCKTATDAVRSAYDDIAKKTVEQARSALRASARKAGKDSDALFGQVAGGADQVTEAQLAKFVEKAGAGLKKEQVTLIVREFGTDGVLRKSGFAQIVQEFQTCTKTIAITDVFDIGEASTVRKLEVGEVFEVLEGPREEGETKVPRVRGRALRDGKEGWVSVTGNQGANFLKAAEKPFLKCVSEAPLHEGFADGSKEVRKLEVDEVLELLEGPREETTKAELLLRGNACKDGAVGWITLRDAAGGTSASSSKDHFVCRSTIAMTDNFDIRECKVVRKVDVGETLQVIRDKGEKEDENIEITRLQFKSLRDDKQGWVTLKGNQGTVFMEPSMSHYVVDREAVTMREGAARDSAPIRELGKGEVFEALEEPKEEKPELKLGLRARALSDSKAGWVLFSSSRPAPLRPHTVK